MRLINRYLNHQLEGICQHSIQLEALNAQVSTYLPEAIRPHCHIGSFAKGCLSLTITDPVWATQLRYYLPELRDKLRSEAKLYQLVSIKINLDHTTQGHRKETKSPKNQKQLSSKARDAILTSAENCTDSALRQALTNLATSNKTDVSK